MEEKYDLFGKCPFVTAQKIIAGKWAVVILHNLSNGTLRFGELQKLLPDLTQATLTKQLRSLEDNGMVRRHVYPQVPPKVEYSLTDIGEDFKSVLDSISVWGEKYIAHMKTMDKISE
ncbi:DNA-binding HxlR family transcriptional regulator [Clostridium saccharoperbutylacetonicum]|uniref:Transcriptional regulator, HxlR family n=1 Tax=Clostridium saccharoperbutylacetonicum N1-4(HMT) TaxID=931276 RepID=M1LXY2_9CLOT|nr:helix-turn-helix domain-containing protein [Clostridium saccharoperbutylacetonicum]AGF58125.1 transcriptional regulator, HxlR family [Clostridium saccharoperbutylacetonicum N1-4(HMT)]NRT61101.1 DNA-binding HxlR family transcriptional regulator [Clostridium saccharoperbutylacetonicum]NSB24416.1 DNA-binding HxlR family transcriptional regulator [Clostridium saccharoperbutylacetonicum]NSB43792.1 DNA-binding HxlR family transcriptional regulator [Clostridium saccharoperbutylacetonicum]